MFRGLGESFLNFLNPPIGSSSPGGDFEKLSDISSETYGNSDTQGGDESGHRGVEAGGSPDVEGSDGSIPFGVGTSFSSGALTNRKPMAVSIMTQSGAADAPTSPVAPMGSRYGGQMREGLVVKQVVAHETAIRISGDDLGMPRARKHASTLEDYSARPDTSDSEQMCLPSSYDDEDEDDEYGSGYSSNSLEKYHDEEGGYADGYGSSSVSSSSGYNSSSFSDDPGDYDHKQHIYNARKMGTPGYIGLLKLEDAIYQEILMEGCIKVAYENTEEEDLISVVVLAPPTSGLVEFIKYRRMRDPDRVGRSRSYVVARPTAREIAHAVVRRERRKVFRAREDALDQFEQRNGRGAIIPDSIMARLSRTQEPKDDSGSLASAAVRAIVEEKHKRELEDIKALEEAEALKASKASKALEKQRDSRPGLLLPVSVPNTGPPLADMPLSDSAFTPASVPVFAPIEPADTDTVTGMHDGGEEDEEIVRSHLHEHTSSTSDSDSDSESTSSDVFAEDYITTWESPSSRVVYAVASLLEYTIYSEILLLIGSPAPFMTEVDRWVTKSRETHLKGGKVPMQFKQYLGLVFDKRERWATDPEDSEELVDKLQLQRTGRLGDIREDEMYRKMDGKNNPGVSESHTAGRMFPVQGTDPATTVEGRSRFDEEHLLGEGKGAEGTLGSLVAGTTTTTTTTTTVQYARPSDEEIRELIYEKEHGSSNGDETDVERFDDTDQHSLVMPEYVEDTEKSRVFVLSDDPIGDADISILKSSPVTYENMWEWTMRAQTAAPDVSMMNIHLEMMVREWRSHCYESMSIMARYQDLATEVYNLQRYIEGRKAYTKGNSDIVIPRADVDTLFSALDDLAQETKAVMSHREAHALKQLIVNRQKRMLEETSSERVEPPTSYVRERHLSSSDSGHV